MESDYGGEFGDGEELGEYCQEECCTQWKQSSVIVIAIGRVVTVREIDYQPQ